jgi:hypothetical protein
MNFFVIGADHRLQIEDVGFEGLVRALSSRVNYIQPLIAIAEEYHENLGVTVCQRIAKEAGLRWFNIDMTEAEKEQAGILEEQRKRPTPLTRLPSDEVRERFWTAKLSSEEPGTTLVICGFLHLSSLVSQLTDGRCAIDQRVYTEDIGKVRCG